MIVHANGKIIGTDTDGNTQPIGATGIAKKQDELKMSGQKIESLLGKILKELIKADLRWALWTDIEIKNHDIKEVR